MLRQVRLPKILWIFVWCGIWIAPLGEAAELEIRLTPKDKVIQENIRNHIGSLAERSKISLKNYLPVALEQAEQALQALGYYQARLQASIEEDPLRLILDIQRGTAVTLRHVDVRVIGEGQALEVFRQPTQALHKGDVLHHGRYESVKGQLLGRASRYGFFDARFISQKISVDPKLGKADISLVLDSGPRYQLGAITFSGKQPIDPGLLQRMAPFVENTPYDAQLIAGLNRALQATGYFSQVRVDANPDHAEDRVIPVHVQLSGRKPRTLGLGAGISTDVGPRLSADWSRHWVNSQGHSYGSKAEISSPKQNVEFWYDVPLDPPLKEKLRFVGGYQFEEIADTDSQSSLFKLGPEWHVEQENGWKRVISLTLLNDRYELGDDSGNSTLLLPGIRYSYLYADNPIDPQQGYRIEWAASAGKEGVISDFDLIHTHLQLRGLTILWQRHRLLGRVEIGANLTNDYGNLPPSLRFFAGGDQSVRGYDYQELSPTDSDDERIGGRYMIASSAEYQYSLDDHWRLAAFVDQGNAFDSLTSPELKTSVGVGVRWVSPVGPIRFDVALPLDTNEDDGKSIGIHFSMGPEL